VVEEQQRLAAVAVPAIVAILKEPTTPESVAQNDWMASRCLSMLPLLGPMKPATAEDVVRILNDGSRSINVRVRAAAALASGADAESKIDATALIQSIGGLAVSSLEGDVAAGDKLLLERQYGGGSGPPLPGAGGSASPDEMSTYSPPVDLTGRPVDQVIPKDPGFVAPPFELYRTCAGGGSPAPVASPTGYSPCSLTPLAARPVNFFSLQSPSGSRQESAPKKVKRDASTLGFDPSCQSSCG
jgi:hypothetical protein